ncbi:MAG: hypothetical protein N5P05_002912 [Chroococcopsis gigantea SAG 12.99]|nr:hypothetical protein [Chroococcopsis gigantea SAG 12.99]
MFVKSLLIPSTAIVLLLGGLLGCTALADLGIAVPDSGNPPVISIEVLTGKPKGAVVYIQGKVTDYAPFLNGGAYLVEDASGQIWIRTKGTPPKVGQSILVKGKIDYQSINVASQDIGGAYVDELEQLQVVATKPQPVTTPSPVVTKPQPVTTPSPVVTKPQPVTTPSPVVTKPASIPVESAENLPTTLKKPKPDSIDSFFLPHKQNQKL